MFWIRSYTKGCLVNLATATDINVVEGHGTSAGKHAVVAFFSMGGPLENANQTIIAIGEKKEMEALVEDILKRLTAHRKALEGAVDNAQASA